MKKFTVDRGEARAGDVRIAYQVSGEGPALVCCHAMGWDHSLWDSHRSSFSNAHKLVTFDQRGSGDSDHPPFSEENKGAYTVDTFAEDLRAVLDKLGIYKANIVGYSMGAIPALRFAINLPDRVEKLVLVSAMASRLPEEIIDRARKVEEVLKQKGLKETYDFYFSGPLFEKAKNADEMKKKIDLSLKKATPHGFSGCYRLTIDRPSMVDELHKITAPTLVLAGERDKHYVVEADLLIGKIPNASKHIVKNAGHALASQEQEEFETQVLRFIS